VFFIIFDKLSPFSPSFHTPEQWKVDIIMLLKQVESSPMYLEVQDETRPRGVVLPKEY
jgi:hypothetical protein